MPLRHSGKFVCICNYTYITPFRNTTPIELMSGFLYLLAKTTATRAERACASVITHRKRVFDCANIVKLCLQICDFGLQIVNLVCRKCVKNLLCINKVIILHCIDCSLRSAAIVLSYMLFIIYIL